MELKKKIQHFLQDRKNLMGLIRYALVGCANTAVDFFLFWLFKRYMDPTVADALALLLAMTFAYVAHKRFVFRTHQPDWRALLREAGTFYGERLLTSLLNVGCMFVFATTLGLWPMGVKVVVTGSIILIDYLASRLLVFRKKPPGGTHL